MLASQAGCRRFESGHPLFVLKHAESCVARANVLPECFLWMCLFIGPTPGVTRHSDATGSVFNQQPTARMAPARLWPRHFEHSGLLGWLICDHRRVVRMLTSRPRCAVFGTLALAGMAAYCRYRHRTDWLEWRQEQAAMLTLPEDDSHATKRVRLYPWWRQFLLGYYDDTPYYKVISY